MIDAIRSAMSRAKSLGRMVSVSRIGNDSVGVRGRKRSPRWRYIRKLDESKVRRIIR